MNSCLKIFILFSLLSSIINNNNVNSNDSNARDENITTDQESEPSEIITEVRGYLKRISYKNDTFITKKIYTNYLNQLFDGQDVPKEQIHVYERVVKLLTTNVPDIFPILDLNKYISESEISDKIRQAMIDLFGEPMKNVRKTGDL